MSDDSPEVLTGVTADPAPAPAVEPPSAPHAQRALDMLLEKEAAVREASRGQEEMATKLARWEALENMSPVEAAAKLGVDLQSFQQHAIANYDPNKALTQKLSTIEARMAERDAKELEDRRSAAITEAQSHVRTYVDSSDKFPLTKSMDMQGLVFDTMQQARQSNQILSEEEAASQVEKSLSDMLGKALGNEGVRARFQESATPAEPSPLASLNNESASSPSATKPAKVLTEQERHESFLSLLKFEN